MLTLTSRKGWGIQRPPLGVQVEYGHPLARGLRFAGLLGEGGGGGVDLITGSIGTLGSGMGWTHREPGVVMNHSGGSTGGTSFETKPQWEVGGSTEGRCSWLAWVHATWGAPGYNPCWLANRGGTTRYSCHIGNGNGETTVLGMFNNSVYRTITHGGFSKNAWHLIGLTISAADVMTGYVDGVPVGTVGSTETSNQSGLPLNIGASTGTSESWQGYIHTVLINERDYSADEMRWLYEEPYAFLSNRSITRYLARAGTPPNLRKFWPGLEHLGGLGA